MHRTLATLVVVLLGLTPAFATKSLPLLKTGEPFYEFVPGQVLVKFAPTATAADIAGLVTQVDGELAYHSELLDFYRIDLSSADVGEVINFFRGQNDVLWANFNYVAHAAYTPNDTYYGYQWHYPRINLPNAWDITLGSASVVVAVADMGFYFDHEDWAGVQTVHPYDFVGGDTDPSTTVDDSHGAHVAGTIIAATNNSVGVAGVAPLCTLMPIRVLDDQGSGSTQTIADGIAWAGTHGAEVLNLSLGYPVSGPPQDPGPPLSTAVASAAAAGVVICAASHNQAQPYVAYPAAYEECIAVGSTGYDDALAPYSNYGSALDVVAPGGNTDQDLNGDGYADGVLSTVRSAQNGDYYVFWQGTSMASPHVAGVAGLLVSNGLATSQVRDALQQTAVDLGSPGWDQTFGHGRIDAHAALQWGGTPELDAPTNLQASLNEATGLVTLTWDHSSLGGDGETDTLIYDNGVYSGAYRWPGATMATHMSPTGACQVLALMFFTTNSGGGSFNAEVYPWSGSQPGTSLLFTTAVTSPANQDWTVVDVSGENLMVAGDFVVGFGSLDEIVHIAYDENLNNGRSWDYSGGSWSSWSEAYLIRAVVEYTGGVVAVTEPALQTINHHVMPAAMESRVEVSGTVPPTKFGVRALDEFQQFEILRDGAVVGNTALGTYDDQLPQGGTYTYVVRAVYDEGTSDNSNPAQVIWTGGGPCVDVTLPATTGVQGQTLEIPLTVGDVTGQNVISLEFTVNFDSQILEPVSPYYSASGTMTDGWTLLESHTTNSLTVGGFSTTALSGSGTLINIVLRVLDGAQIGSSSTLDITTFQFNEGTPCVNAQDGSVEVTQNLASITGAMNYHSVSSPPIANLTIDIDPGGSATSNVSGVYEFADLTINTSYIVAPDGSSEASCDGCISFYDASLAAQYAIGLITLDTLEQCAADASGNEDVSFYDASLIAQYAIGIISEFPCGYSWCFEPTDRSYDPLTGDQTGEDYDGMCVGDPSGNWSGAVLAGPSVQDLRLQEMMSENGILAAENVTNEAAYALEFHCTYDPGKICLESAELTEGLEDWHLFTRAENGVIHIGAFGTAPVGVNAEIVHLRFQPTGLDRTDTEILVTGYRVNESPALSAEAHWTVASAPTEYSLEQNYPNPFNAMTNIRYSLPERASVRLAIYNSLGQQAALLVDEVQEPNIYTLAFDASHLSSGIYFFRLDAGKFHQIHKMILLK